MSVDGASISMKEREEVFSNDTGTTTEDNGSSRIVLTVI